MGRGRCSAEISAGCTRILWGSGENVSGYFGTPSDPQKRWLQHNCDQLSSLTSASKHSLPAPSPCASLLIHVIVVHCDDVCFYIILVLLRVVRLLCVFQEIFSTICSTTSVVVVYSVCVLHVVVQYYV